MISIQLRNIILSLSLHDTFPLLKARMLLASTAARDQCSFSACCPPATTPRASLKKLLPSLAVLRPRYCQTLFLLRCPTIVYSLQPNFIWFPSTHSFSLPRSLCMAALPSSIPTGPYNLLSSARLLRMVSTHSSRLLTKMQHSRDPRTDS